VAGSAASALIGQLIAFGAAPRHEAATISNPPAPTMRFLP
jgi:hypothetical protein